MHLLQFKKITVVFHSNLTKIVCLLHMTIFFHLSYCTKMQKEKS